MIRHSLAALSLLALSLLALSAASHASIVISFAARTVTDQSGNPLPAGTLVQLVNLGADGVFNQISIADGNTSQLGQWVSGDDTLVTASFLNSGSAAGDFPSAAAFDLVNGPDLTLGRISRQMEFALGDIPTGAKLGIRWFPGLQATDFNSITLAYNQPYGEFTRQSNPLYGGTTWVFPSDSANVTFDNLKTPDQVGGLDPAAAGMANQLNVIPEPTVGALAGFGVLSLLARRRRS